MGSNILSQLCTWVNATYGVQLNLKSHTAGSMSFGYGMVHCKYSKHKMNTKIPTEDKVVRVSDYVPYNIWICLFTVAQGYDIK